MKFFGIGTKFMASILALSLFSGCAVNAPIPIPLVTSFDSEGERKESVLLVIDDEFRRYEFVESQVLANFIYPLGEKLPVMIENSLTQSFSHVVVASNSEAKSEYDLIIQPRIKSFEVKIPATIMSRTKTNIEIEYFVLNVNGGKEYTLLGVGDYEITTEEDKVLYKELSESSSSFYYHDVSSGNGVNIPNFAYLAARDAGVAIYHCLNDLDSKLLESLE